MVDQNEFFRNVTLRLCGNLRIEKGLQACFQYISDYIPADEIILERYEKDVGSIRFVARANATECEIMDSLLPLPEPAKTAIEGYEKEHRKGTFPPVMVVNDPDAEPVSRIMQQDCPASSVSSVMILPLFVEDQVAGFLAIIAQGKDRYTDEHAKLFATLREPFFVAMDNALDHQEILRLKDILADDNKYLQRELHQCLGDEIIGADFGLKNVMKMVSKVAPMDSPVLLQGETGVGKDVLANAIHYSSNRSNGPLILMNCGAIPDTLIDSELFGHEKGAFTGANSQKRGRFERAEKGTIFLDEIGELPPQAQVRLLRVLHNKEFERVGGTKPIHTDVRVIAATNRDLGEMVKSGEFREDLWFRLNVFPIMIPPLRARKEDIPALTYHFLERRSRQMKITTAPPLGPGAMDRLMAYNWPGNVRELENIIERALILNPEGPLLFDNLVVPGRTGTGFARMTEPPLGPGDDFKLDTVIANYIKRVLAMTDGKIHGPGGAAELLNINPSTLRSKMKILNIHGKGKTEVKND